MAWRLWLRVALWHSHGCSTSLRDASEFTSGSIFEKPAGNGCCCGCQWRRQRPRCPCILAEPSASRHPSVSDRCIAVEVGWCAAAVAGRSSQGALRAVSDETAKRCNSACGPSGFAELRVAGQVADVGNAPDSVAGRRPPVCLHHTEDQWHGLSIAGAPDVALFQIRSGIPSARGELQSEAFPQCYHTASDTAWQPRVHCHGHSGERRMHPCCGEGADCGRLPHLCGTLRANGEAAREEWCSVCSGLHQHFHG
mmetsp:Transcript_76259/g.176988  ORF Transcript_76259/g.176988 Transcript_76259/m.176988 type:complete len:253 (-) Transcript_76259:399-1157(-)